MTCFAVKFIICKSPKIDHCIDKIKAYDMGDASYEFIKIMNENLGFKRTDYYIIDILEIK